MEGWGRLHIQLSHVPKHWNKNITKLRVQIRRYLKGMATYLPDEGHWNADRVRYRVIDCLDCVGHLVISTEHKIVDSDCSNRE